MEKNETVVAVGESLGTNGEGIARIGDSVLFVPCLLPEEKARVRILKVKGKIAYGKITELYTPAEERVRPACSVFPRCGGCQLQHMRYRSQLKFKTAVVQDALRKIGGIIYPVPPCERSDAEYAYRNKLQLPIGSEKGVNAVGFFAERSHRIVRTEECPIHPDWAKKVIAATYQFMETCGLDGYDAETKRGQLRHIVVRELNRRFIVTLVVTERAIAGIDYFLYLLDGIFPEYSFYLNYQPDDTNAVFGKEFTLLKGAGFYECTENGIAYVAGPSTFVQVNDGVRGKLYERAVSFVEKGETVIDCFSGGGLLTAMFAKKCGKSYGIEVVPEASACADQLKEKNGLSAEMTNICGTVEENLAALIEKEPSATVVFDPPRAGVDRRVLQELIAQNVQKIIMISCNPATLARDLGILTGTLTETQSGELKKADQPCGAYEITYLQPFDMFPQTKHVETLVTLFRKKPDSHIEVTVDFENGKIKKTVL